MNRFEEQLNLLYRSLIGMGEMVINSIAKANTALLEQDVVLAKSIVDSDNIINETERELENLCLKILLQQQPVASDLRLVSAVLKMITDLERIGDHATDISEITILIANQQYIKKLVHIPLMAEATMKMVSDSIDAFVRKDLELAEEIINRDDYVDDLFLTIKTELAELIRENASHGDQALDLLMIAKYFERIGDHATNLAEWVIFSITGVHKSNELA